MGPVESRTREARDLQAGGTGREENCSGRMSWENWPRVPSGWEEERRTRHQAVAHGAKSCAEKSQALKGWCPQPHWQEAGDG